MKVFLRGHWRQEDSSHPLHLLDVSLSGARAHAAVPPANGSVIVIACGIELGLARVSWTRGSYFGIKFEVALTPTVLDRIAAGRDL